MENKKELFKLLIKEFHDLKPPLIIKRDYMLPDCYGPIASDSLPASLSASSAPPSMVAITGPRGCGKTYFIHQLVDHFCCNSTLPIPRSRLIYINFEDDRLLPLSPSDLGALSDAYFELYPDNRDKEVLVFLDEIQHVEGWELFLQRLLERANIRLFVTGCASQFCTRSMSSVLSGRTLELAISPLSFKEFLAFKGLDIAPDFADSDVRFKVINLLEEYITFGGYPEVVLADPSLKLRILSNYYDIFIYKDLVQQHAIRNIVLLKGLLKYLITHIGSGFSTNSYFSDVRRNQHISRETILDYVSILEQKGLISLVPIFSEYPKVQQVNPKKIYCLDNGIRKAVSFPLPQQDEILAKNLVFQKLVRSGDKVFYWRSRREVDFVARQNGKLRALNVSYGRELGDRETSSLLDFQYSVGKRDVDMTIITKDTEKSVQGIQFCPLWKWLLTST
jgi:predicted AAA+ superfamily ATPase